MVSTDTLRRGPLFARLNDAQLQRVADHARTLALDSGNTVFCCLGLAQQ